jgi:hypothetical protein
VASCTSTPLDAGKTTLPKTRNEGDIPRMAIVTGSADPFECLLLKMGISASEIQEPTDAGARIHFFKGEHSSGGIMSSNTPSGTQLYGNIDTLKRYDVVMLPCEGGQYDQSNGRANIGTYVDVGGRVFTTHYSYDWWHYSGSRFDKVGMSWSPELGDNYNSGGIQGVLNTSFPKGMAFAQWLIAAGVSSKSPMGQLNIVQDRHDLTGANPMYAQEWITFQYTSSQGGKGVQHMTFNTPLDAPKDDMGAPQYCGRAVYSDFHVTANALVSGSPTSKWSFPSACNNDPLTDQEKALVFMLFDLSSCVQSDQTAPIP